MKVLPFRKKPTLVIDFALNMSKDPLRRDALLKLQQALQKANQDLEKAVEESFQKIKQHSHLKNEDSK